MAKSARSSTIKSNKVKLKSRLFGPVETARTERLSAKLMELVSLPKPSEKELKGTTMEVEMNVADSSILITTKGSKKEHSMDIDRQGPAKDSGNSKSGRNRIEKRKSRSSKASILFPKYKNGKKIGMLKAKK